MLGVFRSALVSAGLVALSFSACADVLTFGASKDNSIYSDEPDASNGVGNGIFVGETADPGGTEWRRGLIVFDIAGHVPANATITSVSLTLFNSKARNLTPVNIDLHRVTRNWGEGTSDAINNPLPGGGGGGGGGAQATNGDATWDDASFNTTAASAVAWTNPGGDFASTISGSASSAGANFTWASTPQLVADVQGWLANPSSNFGWLLRGDEDDIGTARRFDSRESSTAAFQPALTVTFTSVPEPSGVALVVLGAGVLMRGRRRGGR